MVSNAFSLLQGLMQKLQLAKLKPVSQWSARLIRMLEVFQVSCCGQLRLGCGEEQ